MTQHALPITSDTIEATAAAAFAKSGACVTAIRKHVLQHIHPLECVGFEGLINVIEARSLFTTEFLKDLDVQMDFLTREIDKGTTVHQRYDYDECNVSGPASWQESHLNERAKDLGRAMPQFFELYEALQAVQDLMHAKKALHAWQKTL